MDLTRYPRMHFAHTPTKIESMKNLSRMLGGPNLWIKRDDCTGLSTGGNKTRKLEFLIGDALAQNADTVITVGATQSNHARQTAAACAKSGLKCVILLEDRTHKTDENHNFNGNVLLDKIHGAVIKRIPAEQTPLQAIESEVSGLSSAGKNVYVIPGGGSNAVGALGYANCALEITSQANETGIHFDHLVHATGSAGTQAGLVAGLTAVNNPLPVLGIGVRYPREVQEENVYSLANKTAEHLKLNQSINRESVVANCDYVGPGYGLPAEGTVEAIHLVAQKEGILLDPVYSGKGMAGLIDLVRNNYFEPNQNILFLHTGGSAALFGYLDVFTQ